MGLQYLYTNSLSYANEPWMGWPSFWTHPLPSPNNNGRSCRRGFMHAELMSANTMCGKPPMCTSTMCPSHYIGRGLQTKNCALCKKKSIILVSCIMYYRKTKEEICADILAWARRGGVATPLAYVGFEDTSAHLKRWICAEFLIPRARWAARYWMIHIIGRRWKVFDDTWLKPSQNSDNILWTDVQCDHDWQLPKNLKYDGVHNPKVLYIIEHNYGTCEKSHIPKP